MSDTAAIVLAFCIAIPPVAVYAFFGFRDLRRRQKQEDEYKQRLADEAEWHRNNPAAAQPRPPASPNPPKGKGMTT